MKRRLLIIAVFLLLGAVVNVAVAWLAGLSPGSFIVDSRTDLPTPALVQFVCQRRSSDWYSLLEEGRDNYRGLGYVVYDFDRVDQHQIVQERIRYLKLGFPFKAVEGAEYYSLLETYYWAFESPIESRNGFVHCLPFRPLLGGFAVNTLFYATILWSLIRGPFALRRFLRLRRGLCPKCAYPIGEAAVCTECGKPLAKHALA